MANEHSQIVPSMQPTAKVAVFKFWCQKVLPLVYDDSLSYYEVLNKMVVYLNQVIDNINADIDNIEELEDDFLLLQQYVNNFFDDIDQLVTYTERAEAAQTAAATSAINAASSASNAASSASNAASSSGSAATSALSAMDAKDAAVAAKTAAEAALANAQTAANNAANSANAASGSAINAAASAASAQQSFTLANAASVSAQNSAREAASYVGSPLTANQAADMTNINKIYVYTGNETGYTYGYWYYYNGSSWVSGGKYMGDGGGTAELKNVYDVTTYGAIGDGITDDSGAIRDCIEHLPSSNFILFFPPGNYLQGDGTNPAYPLDGEGHYSGSPTIGEPIYFLLENKTNFEVIGYGAKIIANENNSCIINNRGFEFNNCDNFSVKGLYYKGNIETRQPSGGDSGTYNNQSAFTIRNCKHVIMQDLTADGAVMDGFSIYLDQVDNVYVLSEDIKLLNCYSTKSYRQGLSVCGAKYGIIDGCYFGLTGSVYGTSPQHGIDFETSYGGTQEGWVITNTIFDKNGGAGISLSYHAEKAIITNCTFYDNGIQITNTTLYQRDCKVINNNFYGNCGFSLGGGGLTFKNNYVELGSFITYTHPTGYIGHEDIYENNTFKYTFDITQEESSSGFPATRRGLNLGAINCSFIGNIFINFTDNSSSPSLISRPNTGAINRFNNNSFITDITNYSTYFEFLGYQRNYNIGTEQTGNSVSVAYDVVHDTGVLIIASDNPYRFLGFFNLRLNQNDKVKINIGKTVLYKTNKTYNIRIQFFGHNDEINLLNGAITAGSNNHYTYSLTTEDSTYFLIMERPDTTIANSSPLKVKIGLFDIDVPSSAILSAARITPT